MSLILCPECGTKISDKARVCPFCGYTTDKGILPISISERKFEYVPMFQIENENHELYDSSFFSPDDNKNLYNTFGKFESLKRIAPALADAIANISKGESQFVVNIDSEIRELIKKGDLKFTRTKDGRILASLRDKLGFKKNLDIKEISNVTNITGSIANLGLYMNMQGVMKEIETLHNEIMSIHYEFENDRLALAECAQDTLLFAVKIQDARLRREVIINAISEATNAKRMLMRSFSEDIKSVLLKSNQNGIAAIIDYKERKTLKDKAEKAFKSLSAITNSVQIECQGFAALGEYESSVESLLIFKKFIFENKLNDNDTLLKLNEFCSMGNLNLIDSFTAISEKIERFDKQSLLSINSGSLKYIGVNE